ncbi:MAG: response regulator transcription factor [Myxococcales bacterium]|nr:response regulator transcription factor [Myxococcales bacterium]
MSTVLLVEDDRRLGALFVEVLEGEGHTVELVGSAGAATAALEVAMPDLVLLDLGLPDADGLLWLPTLRQRYDGPVLIVTARGDTDDEVAGLQLGADDYLAKPVRADRLVARVSALLRRVRRAPEGVHVDPQSRTVTVSGRTVEMTTAEFDLLWFLVRRGGQVVTRDALYRGLRGIAWDGVDRSIDLRVSRVRRLIGDDPRQPMRLKTVRGVGYLWVQ